MHDGNAVAPAAGGGYVLAAGPGFLFADETGSVHELAQPEAGRTDVRMNDGACDPQGRFWAGTMAYDESPGGGALYRLELDGSCTTVLTGLTISNGIGWSPDASTMYLDDSGTGLWTPTDRPLAGVTVYIDLNGNGQLDPRDPRTTTNANGAYHFDGLAPGSYLVAQVVAPGARQAFPIQTVATQVLAGQTAYGVFSDLVSLR